MDKEIYVTKSSMPPFDEYVEMIKPLWDTHIITNMGNHHRELEEKLCDFLDVENVSLTVNGHMALELAIQSMNFPKGSEVITTPFTFVSTTHAIIRNGCIPVFCDIKDDYTIDEDKIEELITEKTVAIVPVHVYGNICNVKRIKEIADKYDLKVIYDAAHAFGEKMGKEAIASFGDISVFSFHATKVFNTIEGGAVCSKEKNIYEKIYNLKNFGIRSEELVVSVGANAKMNEFSAAMGLCNLKYISETFEKRKRVVHKYIELLSEIKDIRLNTYRDDIEYNYAYFPILFRNEAIRNLVYEKLLEEKIYARKYFYPITADAVCFKNKYKSCSLEKAREISKRILVIPLYVDLSDDDIYRITEIIKKFIGENHEV